MPASMTPANHLMITVSDGATGVHRMPSTSGELISATQVMLGRADAAKTDHHCEISLRAADVYARLAHAAAIAETGGAR